MKHHGYYWTKGEIEIESTNEQISEVAAAMAVALRSNPNVRLPEEWVETHVASIKPNKRLDYKLASLNDDGTLKK